MQDFVLVSSLKQEGLFNNTGCLHDIGAFEYISSHTARARGGFPGVCGGGMHSLKNDASKVHRKLIYFLFKNSGVVALC